MAYTLQFGGQIYSNPTDPAVVTFNVQTPYKNSHAMKDPPQGKIREAGIIEKLLHSYGFLQCCDRPDRLFFHFTEYIGKIDDLRIGDRVEFEMSYDRRTGKPIACVVAHAEEEPDEIVSDTPCMGTVVTVPDHEQFGSISYEQGGLCFFLPFGQDDIENNRKLIVGTEVSFKIATDKRNGNTAARQVHLPEHHNLAALQTQQSQLVQPQSPVSAAANKPSLVQLNASNTQSKQHHSISDDTATYDTTTAATAKPPIHIKLPSLSSTSNKSSNGRSSSNKCQGVVCSMKESYGFIERADIVKEIFFHFSECRDKPGTDLNLGDDVEFSIQYRSGKEVAQNIFKLPEGSVIFEDVALEHRRGKVEKVLKNSRRQNEPLGGKIVYETVNGPIEIPYGDKDQSGEYTLRVGDMVEFNIATDRRDQLQRATNIALIEDTFKVNGEKRETGVITIVKEGFGFIMCAERDARMFFHFSEIITDDPANLKIQPAQEVEFTIVPDPNQTSRQNAIRIKYLTKGTVIFETTQSQVLVGTVQKEPSNPKNGKSKDVSPGIIMYDVNETQQTIPYNSRAVIGFSPKLEDEVEFQICTSRRNETRTAANVRLIKAQGNNASGAGGISGGGGLKHQGFIATLKDSFGFIELADHNKEVFFHFSAFCGDASSLELGDEVEFTLAKKNKVSAETIKKLPKGTVAPEDVLPEVYDGKVVRCMRVINPDQDEYPGLVKVTGEDVDYESYEYGITSLTDKRDFLQTGDVIKFQIAVVQETGVKRATNITAKREYESAKVESVKGQFGFLDYEAEEGKKLFFHMSEVIDNADLAPGNKVEFILMYNQRNKKYSASNIRKVQEAVQPRPERLHSKLKVAGDAGPKMTVIRQPTAPDGTKGFQFKRTDLHTT